MIQKIIFGMGSTSDLSFYFDTYSIVTVFFLTFTMLFVVFPIRHLKFSAWHLAGRKNDIPESDWESHRDFYIYGSNMALATGLFTQITGIISMLNTMDEPEAIGPGIATSMIGILYGVGLSQFIFLPLSKSFELDLDITTKNQSTKIGLFLCIMIPALTLAHVAISVMGNIDIFS